MFNASKPLIFDKNSPMFKVTQEPQLMLVRHMGFSSYYRNKARNKQFHEEYIQKTRGLTTRYIR